MDINDALGIALDGHAILFLGSGFARGATNIADDDYSLGKGFAKELCAEAKLPEVLELDDAAELYAERLGVPKLIDKLKSSFSAKQVTDFHRKIAEVPWRRVYTTNYDDVFELACSNIGKRVDSVVPLDDISTFSKKNVLCVHLNGFIRRTTEASIWDDIKLTQPSYDKGSSLDTAWGNLFRADLLAARAVFFVGYSLWDLDIRRVLFEEQLREKTFFVLKEPDIATGQRVSRYGLLIAASTQEFAGELTEFQKNYSPSEDHSPIGFCVVPYSLEVSPAHLEDRFVFDLLLYGRLRPELAQASCLGQITYCGPRSVVEISLESLAAGKRLVVFHSALGNGKTLILEMFKYYARSNGMKVFSIISRGETLIEELHAAIMQQGKKVFVVDNYPEWIDLLEFFKAFDSEDFALVTSARSSSNDGLIDHLLENLGTGELIEIPCDSLSGAELDWIVMFFDQFGLWGERASGSREAKLNYLLNKCGGHWSGILLQLLESPQIIERLASLFNGLRNEGAYKEPIVQMLILSILALTPETPVLLDLCGTRILESTFRRDPVVIELVEFSRYSAGVRSAITAEALMKGVINPNVAISAYISLVGRADRIADESAYNRELFKQLIRIANMQLMFAEPNRGRAIMRIYESIKELVHCRRSPLFWLQYAIAATVTGSRERAQSYFDNAYSFARNLTKYDSFQIDNHYSRHLILTALDGGDPRKAMESFREAKRLLIPQFSEERKHHAFRAAVPWGDLYGRFRAAWPESFRNEVQKAAQFVIEKIDQLTQDRFTHRSVQDCLKAMNFILSDSTPPAANSAEPGTETEGNK